MTADTLTLIDFLLARIAEREAHIRADIVGRSYDDPGFELAECEAKRQIVVNVARCIQDAEDGPGSECLRYTAQIVTPTLYALAAVYADHPDFREEWRA